MCLGLVAFAHPSQHHDCGVACSKTASADDANTLVVRGRLTSTSDTVSLIGRLRQTREKIRVTTCGASTIHEGAVILGKNFQQTLCAWVMFANFPDVFESFVIRKNENKCQPQIPDKTFNALKDTSCINIEGGLIPLVLQCCATDMHNGANRAIRLQLLTSGTETIDTSFTLKPKRTGGVCYSVPFRKD